MPAYVTNLIGIPLSFPHQENCTAIPVKQAWKLKYHQNKHCLMDWIYTKVRIGAWQFEEKKNWSCALFYYNTACTLTKEHNKAAIILTCTSLSNK